MRSLLRFLPCLALLLLVPLASCTEASAVTLSAFGAAQAGDSLRLSATFHLDPTIDSGAAVFRVKTASKRVKLAAVATGASARFALPAEGETVTGYLTLTLWKSGTAPVSVSDSVRYTRPVTPIVPPVIDGFTAEQAAAILDSAPVMAYLTAIAAAAPCHAEIRDYITGTILVPLALERPTCDATVLRLGWYAMMDSTGRGTAPSSTLGAFNAGQVHRGRAQSATVRAVWAAVARSLPARITVTDAACCDDLRHDWPMPDSLAVRISMWRGV